MNQATTQPQKWACLSCGFIYDEGLGDPEHDVPAHTAWNMVPMNWVCPECRGRKDDFEVLTQN